MCDADDGPSACHETWRTARKEHDCYACGEVIRRGDRYHFTSGIWDGYPGSFKHCARCWKMFQWILGWSDAEAVRYDLGCGEVAENPPDDVAALAFMTADEAQVLAATTHRRETP